MKISKTILIISFLSSTIIPSCFDIVPLPSWFDIVPLKQVLDENPNIHYQKCFGDVSFNFEQFALDATYPNKGTFKECFILTIPKGKVQSRYGFTIINNHYIKEI